MKEILNHLFEYKTLKQSEAREVLTNIASGKYNDTQIAVFLTVSFPTISPAVTITKGADIWRF